MLQPTSLIRLFREERDKESKKQTKLMEGERKKKEIKIRRERNTERWDREEQKFFIFQEFKNFIS